MAAKDPYAALRRGEIAPLYFVDGVELLAMELVRAIRRVVFPPGATGEDFNFERLSAKDAGVTVGRVLDAARTLPAFSDRRLVVVTDAEHLWKTRSKGDAEDGEERGAAKKAGRKKKDEDPGQAALITYAKNPSPTTTLVLVAGEKLSKSTRLYKAFDKAGAAVRFEEPDGKTMPGLVAQRAKGLGLELTAPAKADLLEAVGADLVAMRNALDILDLYLGERRRVEPGDVEAVVSAVPQDKIFDLVDAIVEGRLPRALDLLGQMVRASKDLGPLFMLLGMLSKHYGRLIRARSALDLGTDPGALSQRLGVRPYAAERLARQCRSAGVARFARGLTSIATADGWLKGGTRHIAPTRVIERLVVALARDEVVVPDPAPSPRIVSGP